MNILGTSYRIPYSMLWGTPAERGVIDGEDAAVDDKRGEACGWAGAGRMGRFIKRALKLQK